MLDTPKKAAGLAANNGPARARPPQPPAPPAKSDAAKPAAPAPEPTAPETTVPETDPTRYGDWEKKGRCIDF
jgi:hypothetical protein